MNLRPHHLLCIQKFTGHGYDEAFTAHMTSIVSKLKSAPETGITLVKDCDTLCAVCPNNRDGACTALEKVDGMDSGVLSACGLPYGGAVPWSTLASAAQAQVFETDRFRTICGDCEWFSLCAQTETTK